MKAPAYNPDWSDDLKALYRHDIQEIWDPTISKHVWNQYHNQLDLYLNIADKVSSGKRIKILDVGCAQGTLALLLAECGHYVCAVDLRPQFLEYAHSRYVYGDIHFIEGNALTLALDEHFDLIFVNQMIEHLIYPKLLVHGMRRLLVAGGLLVVTTPNWHYIVNTTLPSFEELGDLSLYEKRQFTADGDGHFYAYRANELVRILLEQEFVDIQTKYFETPFISGHLKLRHLHRLLPVGPLRWLDRFILFIPCLRVFLSHQLMIIGRNP